MAAEDPSINEPPPRAGWPNLWVLLLVVLGIVAVVAILVIRSYAGFAGH